MEGLSKDVILLLQYLLPGLFAAWIFYGLTPFELPSQFERVVQALILTLIVQTVVFAEKALVDRLGQPWGWNLGNDTPRLVASTLTALVIGLIFSFCANHDTFHRLARKIGITKEASYPSQWFSAFRKNITYVVLQLNDERRLYGWPLEWPSNRKEGQFILQEASWLTTEEGQSKEHPIVGVSSILIEVGDVKWVEFMDRTWDKEK